MNKIHWRTTSELSFSTKRRQSLHNTFKIVITGDTIGDTLYQINWTRWLQEMSNEVQYGYNLVQIVLNL